MYIGYNIDIPESVSMFEGRLTIGIHGEKSENGDALLLFADGDLVFEEPFVEPQPRLDPHAGFSFDIRIPEPEKILAVYQHKSWWVRPEFPETCAKIPDRTQMLLLKYREETVCLAATCGDVFRTDFCGVSCAGDDAGKTTIRVRTSSNRVGDCRVHTPLFAIASASNPYKAVRQAEALPGEMAKMLPRSKREYPDLFEGFGWCTWDAFYRDVSEEGIIAKLEEFREKKVPVRWVLIDDGWIDADYEKLTISGFDAVREKFPNGLAGTVKIIKEKYGVEYVGVWHAAFGYWCGVTPGSAAEKKLGEFCTYLPDGRIVIAPDSKKSFGFYDAWHSYLKAQGIDFVKVDNQSAISVICDGIYPFGASKKILKGLEKSVEKNFDGAIINCMGMAPQEHWARRKTCLTRTSDDFFPNQEGSFIEHAIQNSYNSLWSGPFYIGDWDMFFTEHPEAQNNAALRAVSGGPVYVSDKVGKTDPKWLESLMDRNGWIKRCDGVGLPAQSDLFEDPRKGGPLKVVNRRGGEILVGAFDLVRNGEKVRGSISTGDLLPAGESAVSASYHVSGVFGGGSGMLTPDEPYVFELENGGSELFVLKS